MNKTKYILLASALLLAACGNPEKAAQHTMDKVQTDLQKAQSDLNPQKRLDAYERMIKDVQSVAKKTKTSAGRTIANGGSVDGVSLSKLQSLHDALAPRAKCYENPTVECLTPFGSGQTSRSSQSSPQSAFAVAEELVCKKGFAAADKALEPFKINKDAYVKELIQVGFAAAKCNKPDEVKAAIGTYMKADPNQGDQRVSDLLSILGTADLSAAHPMIISELENGLKSGTISGQGAANVTLTLAVDYAEDGNAKAAMEKYTTFTDTLHYQADSSTIDTLAQNLIADGDMDDGVKLTPYSDHVDTLANQLHSAVALLGRRMGLVDQTSTWQAAMTVDNYKTFFDPVDGAKKAQYEAGANAIEAAYDKLAPTIDQSNGVGINGLDNGYGILALIRRKLGENDKSAAALKKGEDLRLRLLGPSADRDHLGAFAQWQAPLAIADGDLTKAATANHLGGLHYESIIYEEAGRTLDAEKSISIINTITGANDPYNAYNVVIKSMSTAGKTQDVEKMIAAYPGNPGLKKDLYWTVIDGMIANGDVNAAKSYAQKHDLVKDDKGKQSLDARLLASKKIAGNRGKAEPLIREMFKIGEARDKEVNAKGDSYTERYAFSGKSDQAQTAASMAFENGYTDLGIELYEKATNKDHRPLLQAFTDKISKSDMTKVLMLAQDNAGSPQYLSYVIDAAIRHLQKTS